ncbi:hypothetical protein QCA50_003344 [Cerrena zonata]|uniref:N-acetyltransferase domain-containing protein n=1 Tax=Cerrena zonata TaxID=2478898 RepID=A0AAW0GMA9_9APHY
MTKTQLYRLDTKSPQAVEHLADILRPHIPVCLPVLGTFYSGDLAGGYLSVWVTFDLSSTHEPPDLFSVITFSPLAYDKLRFFCSAETKDTPPTPEEETHVVGVITTLYKALRDSSPLAEGISREIALSEEFERNDVIRIGALHEKWVPCLRHTAARMNEDVCTKFFRPPRPSPSDSPDDDRWDISPLRESDIDLVTDRAPYKRPREAMLTRLPYSICIKPKGTDIPVAWQLLYPDGSIGMLHVEPEYRRMGLGKLVVRALCKKLEELFYTEDEEKVGKYPWARWEMVDVVNGNQKSASLLKALESDGWQKGWSNRWFFMAMDLESDPDDVAGP